MDGKKLVTLYDKDLTEGVNLLIGTLCGCGRFFFKGESEHVILNFNLCRSNDNEVIPQLSVIVLKTNSP